LRYHLGALHIPDMKQRKPKDLADERDKPLRVRYSEVVELRELVKKAQSEVSDAEFKQSKS
jgi:hypothetical protein